MSAIFTAVFIVSDELGRLLSHSSLSYTTKYRLLCQAAASGEAALFSGHVPEVKQPVAVEYELEAMEG